MHSSHEFERGYFCALAALVRYDGWVTAISEELFAAGGDWRHADEEDIQTLKDVGLIAGRIQVDTAIRKEFGGESA